MPVKKSFQEINEKIKKGKAEIPEILACVVIAGGELGIRGEFETKRLS